MTLSDYTLASIEEFFSGDNGLAPRLSGPQILILFNNVGYKDTYTWGSGGGMPNGLSRNAYVSEKLKELNGQKGLVELIELVFDPRHFTKNNELDIGLSTDKFNDLIQFDGYRLENVDGRYKLIGSDLPDTIKVEVHFEDIQAQIIEQVQQAKFCIWVAVAWFTNKVLLNALINKSKQGVNIRLLVLDDEINRTNGFDYEKYFETVRLSPNGNLMHHKFCVIDLKTVVHGSYNWTNRARWNKETVVVESSRELAESFAAEFIELVNSSGSSTQLNQTQ